jgi:ribosomal protein S18 acetylase RimI-like enzyme
LGGKLPWHSAQARRSDASPNAKGLAKDRKTGKKGLQTDHWQEPGMSINIRKATASDAWHLVRFINMAADDLPLHFWRKSVGPNGDALGYGQERAARDTGNFSYNNAWMAEVDGAVGAGLLGYPAEVTPGPIAPDTPEIFVPLLELEAMAPGSWYLNVLATYEAFRGKGLASALLAHAEWIAGSAGHDTISLIAEDTHDAALRLYAAKGFRQVARRPVIKGDWAVGATEWILFTKRIVHS